MNSRPFQLERTMRGTFLLQGVAGGALGGFLLIVVSGFRSVSGNFYELLFLTPILMFAGAVVGTVEATAIWGIYGLTGVRPGVVSRVAITTIVSTLLVVLLGLRFEFHVNDYAGWLLTVLSVGISTAVFVGSSIKPWGLFTFGSIALGEGRAGSKSFWATAGTLPLRFLSLAIIWLWILVIVSIPENEVSPIRIALALIVPLIYPAISAYITFRSPRKIILFITGLAINLPIAFIGYFAYSSYPKAWLSEALLMLSIICALFIVAWVIFLVARLTAPTDPYMPLSILMTSPSHHRKPDEHHCLGSRFLEWHERAAF